MIFIEIIVEFILLFVHILKLCLKIKLQKKKIARIVKSELDKGNYEDTAWLKAFKEAGGDKNQARAIYVGVRSKDLEDEFYEEQSKIEQEKIDKENKIEQEKADRENRLEQLRLKKDELKNRRNVRERERSAYSYSKIPVNNDSFLESNIKPFIRGEYSLPFSYWYIGFLCSIIVNLPLFVIEAQKKLIEHNLNSDGRKLTVTKVMLIKKLLAKPDQKTRLKMIAKQFGVSEMQIRRIKSGENWSQIKI